MDQYGGRVYARTVKELREKAGGGSVSKMMRDQKDGPPIHVGYVVGKLWFTEYKVNVRKA